MFLGNDHGFSYTVLEHKASGFNSKWVPKEQREKYKQLYFDNLHNQLSSKSMEFAKVYFYALSPDMQPGEYNQLMAKCWEGKENLNTY